MVYKYLVNNYSDSLLTSLPGTSHFKRRTFYPIFIINAYLFTYHSVLSIFSHKSLVPITRTLNLLDIYNRRLFKLYFKNVHITCHIIFVETSG